jgi:hypothetical protein
MSDKPTDSSAQGRRNLVIANETVAGAALHQAIRFRAQNVAGDVLVVVPALGSRLGDRPADARAAAEDRLGRALTRLRAAGVRARGQLGDRDPLRAIGDALAGFAADEILLATHPAARSRWLAGDVLARARSRFGVPVFHVVVRDDDGPGHGGGRARRFAGGMLAPTLSAS